jgi:hypothetical protein
MVNDRIQGRITSGLAPGTTVWKTLQFVKAVIEGRSYSLLDPFLVLEGKRLPPPKPDREREYVTGGDKKSGGIQRFKLALHGALLRHAGMIGYVQRDSFDDWFTSINVWITDLAESTSEWSQEDCLSELTTDVANRVASCISVHTRVDAVTGKIHLSHLWVDMQQACRGNGAGGAVQPSWFGRDYRLLPPPHRGGQAGRAARPQWRPDAGVVGCHVRFG